MEEARRRELDRIFYCRSIAVVGATKEETKAGNMFVRALIGAGFTGPIYPINPYESGEVHGWPIYPRLQDVRGEVDMVVVAVPRAAVLEVLEDCATKGVKAAQFFTAGFRELDSAAGRRLEADMLKIARRGRFRIIGPNCVGTCVPAVGKPLLGPTTHGTLPPQGNAACLSQSGGIAGELVEMAAVRGIGFGKLISFGNGLDLDGVELLDYFGSDPETEVVGAYLEGTDRGQELFRVAREVARRKPLVVWKGGGTPAGAEAAASHTGSLAASDAVWSAALRQAGAVKVSSMEEMADVLMAFQSIAPVRGNRVALVTGLAAGGGGDSVSGADILLRHGLQVPPFAPHTLSRLEALLGRLGSILRNPLDASQRARTLEVLTEAISAVVADPNTDIIVVQEHMGIMVEFHTPDRLQAINDMFLDIHRRGAKPVVLVLPRGQAEANREEKEKLFRQAGVPVFPSVESAARALGHLTGYYLRRSRSP